MLRKSEFYHIKHKNDARGSILLHVSTILHTKFTVVRMIPPLEVQSRMLTQSELTLLFVIRKFDFKKL